MVSFVAISIEFHQLTSLQHAAFLVFKLTARRQRGQLVEFYRYGNERNHIEALFLTKLFFELAFFGTKTKMQSLSLNFNGPPI
jgi:hypothetical protein